MKLRHPVIRVGLACAVIASPGFLMSFNKPATPAKPRQQKASPTPVAPADDEFGKIVQPVLRKSCLPCHNQNVASGEVSFHELTSSATLTSRRDVLERALRMVNSSETGQNEST